MYGEHLKKLREERNMSQEKLAEELHVSRQAISKWENNKAMPDIENLKALGNLYGISMNELLEYTNIVIENEVEDNKKTSRTEEALINNNDFIGVLMITIAVVATLIFPIGIVVNLIFLCKSKDLKNRFWKWAVIIVCFACLGVCIYDCYFLISMKLREGVGSVEYLG